MHYFSTVSNFQKSPRQALGEESLLSMGVCSGGQGVRATLDFQTWYKYSK